MGYLDVIEHELQLYKGWGFLNIALLEGGVLEHDASIIIF